MYFYHIQEEYPALPGMFLCLADYSMPKYVWALAGIKVHRAPYWPKNELASSVCNNKRYNDLISGIISLCYSPCNAESANIWHVGLRTVPLCKHPSPSVEILFYRDRDRDIVIGIIIIIIIGIIFIIYYWYISTRGMYGTWHPCLLMLYCHVILNSCYN